MARTEVSRFWDKVERTSTCWVWHGSRSRKGYGGFRLSRPGPYVIGRLVKAHRYAYESIRGKIPDGLHLDHLCKHPWCVNPEHLEPVTNKENSLRGTSGPAQNARKTHCKSGHKFTKINTYVDSRGWRKCRMCRANSMRNQKQTSKGTEHERQLGRT